MSIRSKAIKHPCVIKDKRIRGGSPVIAGTGIRVLDIAIRYEVMGMTPDEIMIAFPHITLSQIHDALSYYYEYKDELDREWKTCLNKVERMKRSHRPVLEEKIAKLDSSPSRSLS